MDMDRLSSLPDDLLRRILYFAPAKEGASTAVLSRRWRSLWPTSGAINLDSRLGTDYLTDDDVRARRKALFCSDKAALASAHAHSQVKKFSLHVAAGNCHTIAKLLTRQRIHTVLSNPAIQHVEELSIGATETYDRRNPMTSSDPFTDTRESCQLSFGALPSETLGVLHITNCRHLKPPLSTATFPRLRDLRLQGCVLSLADLQRVVDAAPHLTTLQLESFSFPRGDTVEGRKDASAIGHSSYQLLCPTVRTLVLKDCNWEQVEGTLELDMRSLQYFVYKGEIRHCNRISLHGSTDLVQVDVHLTLYRTYTLRDTSECQYRAPMWFWQFMQNFKVTKAFKLKLDFTIDFIAVVDQKGEDEILRNSLFSNLEKLDLDVHYNPASKTAAFALANFLQRSPVIRVLHIGLMQFILRRHKRTRASMGTDYDSEKYVISDIHEFCSESFNFLKSHLRRVSLMFWMENPDCFGVQLAKFFAKEAMVLEEMIIDDGSQKMCDHINHKIGRWIFTDSSKRKILKASLGLKSPMAWHTVLGKVIEDD